MQITKTDNFIVNIKSPIQLKCLVHLCIPYVRLDDYNTKRLVRQHKNDIHENKKRAEALLMCHRCLINDKRRYVVGSKVGQAFVFRAVLKRPAKLSDGS